MHLHFITTPDILKYLLISLDTFNGNSIRMTRLNLCIPYLHYVLLLDPVLFDKVFIDLVKLFVIPTGNRRLRCQLIPLVNPHLEPTRLGFQVH